MIFPVINARILPNAQAAVYLRLLADEFASLSTIEVTDAGYADWAAVEAALEAVSDALDWIRS